MGMDELKFGIWSLGAVPATSTTRCLTYPQRSLDVAQKLYALR